MAIEELQAGDMIYAANDIYNDGSIPDVAKGELIAASGCRGVLINVGHIEEDEEQSVYLVRFENKSGELMLPVGCWPQELTDQVC